jgi:hypothetical protein
MKNYFFFLFINQQTIPFFLFVSNFLLFLIVLYEYFFSFNKNQNIGKNCFPVTDIVLFSHQLL